MHALTQYLLGDFALGLGLGSGMYHVKPWNKELQFWKEWGFYDRW